VRTGNVVALAAAAGGSARIAAEVRTSADSGTVTREIKRRVRQEIGIGVSEVILVSPSQIPKTSSGKLRRAHTAMLLDSGALTGEASR
jgi:fatty-acyl-CoA synthase